MSETVKVDDLQVPTEYHRGVRYRSLDMAVSMVQKFGITQPIMVNVRDDGTAVVIDGVQRVAACRELGIEEIEADVHRGLSREDEVILFVAANTRSPVR